MKLLTQQMLLDTVVSRYRFAYGDLYNTNGHVRNIYNQLIVLGKNKTAADVNEIFGNTRWTTYLCDSCHGYVAHVVSFEVNDGEYDYGICENCLRDALGMFRKEESD